MAAVRESDLAWELVERFRESFTAAELSRAFINLGVGEYTTVINAVLDAVARAGRSLPAESAARVRAWRDCYDQPQRPAVTFAESAD